MPGYTGKILDIDLSSGKIDVYALPEQMASRFLGGTGFGSKIVYDQVGFDADPLGPRNIIIFAPGPLNGTGAPFSGRMDVVAQSPLTGLLGLTNTGGGCGVEIKKAGYDALVVRNISAKPVYIYINNSRVEIRDAGNIWGKDVWETTRWLKDELAGSPGKEVKVMAIGPAGENLVRFAAIIEEFYHAAARCGLGAVMGSKKLKAVVVRGTGTVAVADPAGFRQAVRDVLDRSRNGWHPGARIALQGRRTFVSLPTLRGKYEQGTLAGKNFQASRLPGWLENNTLDSAKKYITREYASCPACPWRCFHLAEVNEGKYAGLKVCSATFSGSMQFGSMCALGNVPAVWKAKDACHRLGLDIHSASTVVAFAMELYQRGILTAKDTGGLALDWGNDDAVLELLARIAYRRGLGGVLAEGTRRAAEAIGHGAERYSLTIKGMEAAGSPDPRGVRKIWSAGYLDNPRGGDNIRNTHAELGGMPPERVVRERFGMTPEEYCREFVASLDIFEEEKLQIFGAPPQLDEDSFEGKAALTKWLGDLCTVLNSLVLCFFPTTVGQCSVGPTMYARLYTTATGIDLSSRELMKAGERIFNLQRMYLVGRGISSKDDDFPARFYDEGLSDGPHRGAHFDREQIEALKQEYYRLRGWDRDGKPTESKLRELDLV